jgi:S1-C subfamily serine protease
MNVNLTSCGWWRFGVNSLLFAALFSSSAGHLPAAPAEPDIRRDAVVVATERVMPAVVNIATKNLVPVRDPLDEVLRQFWGPYYKSQAPDEPFSLGSGVGIDEAG